MVFGLLLYVDHASTFQIELVICTLQTTVIQLWDRLKEHSDSGVISSLHIIVFQMSVDAPQPCSSSPETSDPLDIPHRLQVVYVAKTVPFS